MLQTQLQEAQQALEQAAQQHRDSLVTLQEERRVLLQDRTELQKQVPAPLSQPRNPSQHSNPSPAQPGPPTPPGRMGKPWPCCLSLGWGGEAPVLSEK